MTALRDALRTLRSAPVVTAVAILSLALGIGANTAVFSILDTLLLRSLPVRNAQDLAIMTSADADTWTYPIWRELSERQGAFAGAAAWSSVRFNAADTGPADPVNGLWVSGRFFDVLGVPAMLGRTLTDRDDERGAPDGAAAVISYAFWQSRFGGAADVVGRTIRLDKVAFTIVGVTPPEFFGPEVGSRFDVAAPFGTEPLLRGRESLLGTRSSWWISIMVRRKPNQSVAAAAAALRAIQPQIREATIPTTFRPQDQKTYLAAPLQLVPAATGSSYLRERYERPLLTIQIVVGLVLLIACANIANLLMARATARRHELSVRMALGASRAQLARQLVTESLLLACAGAIAGLGFAQWGSRLIVAALSTRLNQIVLNLNPDWRVLGFTAAVAIATALFFGTMPALRAAAAQPQESLREQGRGVHGETRMGIGAALVVAQIALSLMLVVAAGLFVRTFWQLAGRPLGFDRDRLLAVSVELRDRNADTAQRVAVFEQLREAAQAAPGVDSATASEVTPVSGSSWQFLIEIPGGAPMSEHERGVYVNIIGADFFRTFGTRLVAGREFDTRDKAGSTPVAIVNETFARKFLNGSNPLGRQVVQVGFPGRPAVTREIVGLSSDAVYRNLRQTIPPTMYIPLTQQPKLGAFVVVTAKASSDSPALLARSLASALLAVSPDATLTIRTVAEQVANSLIQERLVASLSGFFGGLALLLAGIGLYGVTSYAVSRRRSEIGIRMALGAVPAGIMRLVLVRVAWLVSAGIAAGVIAAIWASHFVASLLFGVTARDPVTLTSAAAVLAAIALLAGGLPAWRAARIDPARVLRES